MNKNPEQKSKIDPLDPYQSYYFHDQNSPISETNLIKERQIINEKLESLGKSHPILIAVLIIIFACILGVGLSFFNGWIKFF